MRADSTWKDSAWKFCCSGMICETVNSSRCTCCSPPPPWVIASGSMTSEVVPACSPEGRSWTRMPCRSDSRADHEQAHALGDRGVHGRRVGQFVVDVREVLGGEADALVVDLDHDAAVRETGRGDADLGLRGGERGGVLQQLGEQVHEVGHGAAVDLGLGDAGELDALVLLHLGGGGAQDVHERHRLVPAAAGLLMRRGRGGSRRCGAYGSRGGPGGRGSPAGPGRPRCSPGR